MTDTTAPTLAVTLVGGPTAVLEYGGLRFLTDPTLSPPSTYAGLVKTAGPARDAAAIGSIDAVLVARPARRQPRPRRSRAAAGGRSRP